MVVFKAGSMFEKYTTEVNKLDSFRSATYKVSLCHLFIRSLLTYSCCGIFE